MLEARATVGLRSEQRPRDRDIVGRDLEHLAKDALSSWTLGDGDDGGVVSIAPGWIGAALHCNHSPIQLVLVGILGFYVDEAAAGEIAAIKCSSRRAGGSGITVHELFC